MVSPLRTSPDPSDQGAFHRLPPFPMPDCGHRHVGAGSRPDEAAGDDDLRRLEASLAWLKRESMVVGPQAGYRRLPRAALLPPVSEISPLNTAGSGGRGEPTSIFVLAPPLRRDRLQLSRRQARHRLRGAMYLLIAGVIAGSIVYHVSPTGVLSAWAPAQASALQAP